MISRREYLKFSLAAGTLLAAELLDGLRVAVPPASSCR
jgi:hypothetical protein